MRPVKTARKPSAAARNRPQRRGSATGRVQFERASVRSAPRPGRLTRAWQTVAQSSVARRPLLHLTGALILASLLVAVIAGGYLGGLRTLEHRVTDAVATGAGFGIASVHLSGNGRTPPSAIIAALGFEPGQSIFDADIHEARARLLALDWVADAQVRRQYPDSIAVALVEKLPFALWQSQNGVYVVERSGRPIVKVAPSEFPHLPFFVGEGAPDAGAELVDAIATHRAVASRIKAMQRVSGRRWNLLLDDGVVVELPETGWKSQLDELEHLIVDQGVLERDITEIDLRSPDNLFFQLRNGGKPADTKGNAT